MPSPKIQDSLNQLKASAYCALRIILMCMRVSEVREHAVAHVLRYKSAGLGNLFSAAAMVAGDDLPHVFGIEASGESGRADEVAEHDGNLPALGGVLGGPVGWRSRLGLWCFRARVSAQGGNGHKQLTAVPDDTYAKIL